MPGSRSAPCLGCGRRVVTARDAHVTFGGKRDGSLLIAWDVEPQRAYSDVTDRLYEADELYLLGVAHRACGPLARWRLETQQVDLPDILCELILDEGDTSELPAMHLPPSGDWCAFCGRDDPSEEHIFPRWVSKELSKLAAGPLEMKTAHGPRRITTLDLTAPICAACNTRWLSVLENDVKPLLASMIGGEERALSTGEQGRLATWAVKTAFMLDLAGTAPVIPAGYYYMLRQRRNALGSNVVLCGAYLGSKKAIWAEHRGLHAGISDDEPPNMFVTTFSIFRVVFQVVGHFTKRRSDFFNDNRDIAIGLTQIWPAQPEPVRWPRDRLAFNDDTLIELARSVGT